MQDFDHCWPAQECGCEIKLVIQLMVVKKLTEEEATKKKINCRRDIWHSNHSD